MQSFVNLFPEIAEKETRIMHVFRRSKEIPLPPDEYVFAEYYCDEKGCDCRRVMICVQAMKARRIMATISLGFDSMDPDAGPFLDDLNSQSSHSNLFLHYFLNMINEDSAYLKRLQQHYVMFKEKIEKKPYNGKPFERPGTVVRTAKEPLPLDLPTLSETPRVGRNAPCPCGSGKKYKKCCLNKTAGNKTSFGPKTTAGGKKVSTPPALKDGPAGELADDMDFTKVRNMVETVSSRLSAAKPDPLTTNEMKTLEENPKLVFALLSVLIAAYGGKKGEKQRGVPYNAMLILMEEALTQLRYSVERKRPWAMDAARKIQKEMAEKVLQISVDVRVQGDILQAFHASGLKINPEIQEKAGELAEYYGRFQNEADPSRFKRLSQNAAKGAKGSAFVLYEQMVPNLAVLSREAKLAALFEMVRTGNSLMGEMAVLMLLYPDPEMRMPLATLLDNVLLPENITPKAFRWMIGFRNWLPKKERPGVDRLIKKARRARIDCAAMPQYRQAMIYASAFDGSGMQLISGISQKQRFSQVVSVLVRQGEGIRELHVDPKVTKSERKAHLRRIEGNPASLKVDLNYLKKLVSHFIYVGQQENAVPPPGLLKAAENLAGEYWYPVAVDFEKEITFLEAQLPAEFGNKAKVREVLENSRQWPEMPFGHSWFEDDAEVDKCVRTFAGRSGEKPGGIRQAQKMILKFIIEGKRRDWGERMLWMALRSLLCLDRNPLPWAPFMIVSRELLSGTPLRDIPLMESVAERSAWSGLRRLGEFPQ